ncbi:MAG: GNAT family N-acetyltransferase [Gemmatimonadota bacterium]|nr:GNAT family N-acetyltransferase [Gemmatimonadota bacterium]
MPLRVQPQSSEVAVAACEVPHAVVRRATVRDLDAVMQLRLALLREYPDHPIYGRLQPDVSARARTLFDAQLRSPSDSIFLASFARARGRGAAAESVGILRCTESTNSPLLMPLRYAYVSSVYVRPDARRRGVLRALLAAAEQWARARGLEEMRLHNVADSVSAEGAWSALGFAVVEHVRWRRMTPEPGLDATT